MLKLVLQGNIHGNISSVAFSEDDALAKNIILIMTTIDILEDRQEWYILVRETRLECAVEGFLETICSSSVPVHESP